MALGFLVAIRSVINVWNWAYNILQKEVLGNLGVCGTEKSYTEIAEAMNISVDGFQTHIYQIKKVLSISGSDGKEQLIQYAKDNNLLSYASISCD